MTHITDENLSVKIGDEEYLLLAIQYISELMAVVFVTQHPNKSVL